MRRTPGSGGRSGEVGGGGMGHSVGAGSRGANGLSRVWNQPSSAKSHTTARWSEATSKTVRVEQPEVAIEHDVELGIEAREVAAGGGGREPRQPLVLRAGDQPGGLVERHVGEPAGLVHRTVGGGGAGVVVHVARQHVGSAAQAVLLEGLAQRPHLLAARVRPGEDDEVRRRDGDGPCRGLEDRTEHGALVPVVREAQERTGRLEGRDERVADGGRDPRVVGDDEAGGGVPVGELETGAGERGPQLRLGDAEDLLEPDHAGAGRAERLETAGRCAAGHRCRCWPWRRSGWCWCSSWPGAHAHRRRGDGLDLVMGHLAWVRRRSLRLAA